MLTKRQQEILDYVHAHQRQHGSPPTLREIQAHFDFASPFAVTRHLQALEKKGALSRRPGKARGFTSPTLHNPSFISVPLYGTIPAGLPVEAEQQTDRHVSIDPTAFGLRDNIYLFALTVRGDSMTGASILDGDVVFLTQRESRAGDIVAALIDGESTLKRFLVQRGRPYLRAENPRYPDLLPARELVIQGVMVGLLRPHA
jgi:repressor LexA